MANKKKSFYDRRDKKHQDILYLLIALLIFIFAFGMIGYRCLYEGNWLEAFYDTAITVSTLALARGSNTDHPLKLIFIAMLALMSSILFLTTAAYMVTQMIKYIQE